ncbi:aminotransferase class I/II-fold pyridoxal phosphate-dependent enzyme [Puniceicoccus vermicola]|uniref:Pyridoxal phosphate-dependent aminotransferase family protein n=1 Tax=Puniceicoccus vermicola TaxID=388746 RepID=A0A7X1E5S0_9BACT|nr:pyridoxal phosphate-dependent aminotransferase family protein [Puniceicoccus vermicola]MBC2601897.1 pyridoxal phosphate-dependent aminotransferase family protein [Puniceicoccus vermicola]
MAIFPSRKNQKSRIARRCEDDSVTKLRLKYAPYYYTFDRQEGTRVWREGKPYIMLSSNDYLGLGNHPKVVEAGREALKKWGSSTTGARLANGSRTYHTELEEELADFIGKEACHVHAAGYLSCMSAVATFAERGDLIVVDKNVHSSLWSGIHLSGATAERFIHNNPDDLRDVLIHEDPDRAKLLLFEGVYSMEGHVAKMPELMEVARENDMFSVMDDAHGFGVMGPGGRGTAAHFGLESEIDVISGSFSKALSSTGGYVAGSRAMIDYLRTHSKQTIFSAAISPSQAACALASLRVLKEEPEHLERLWKNTRRYKEMLENMGLDTWGSETPAMPIVLGTKEKVYSFWKDLLSKGVFTVMSVAPGVPPGKDLVRTAISARHTDEDLDKVGDALAYAARSL